MISLLLILIGFIMILISSIVIKKKDISFVTFSAGVIGGFIIICGFTIWLFNI